MFIGFFLASAALPVETGVRARSFAVVVAVPWRERSSLALLDVYGRVARTLLDMAEQDGVPESVRSADAILVPMGFGPRGTEGKTVTTTYDVKAAKK